MAYILLFLLAITAASFSNAQDDPCTGMMSDGSFTVEWETDEDDDYVQFTYSAETTEWVGLGFSLTPGMINSDVVVGAIEGDEYFVEDRYVGDTRIPVFDTTQNIKNVSAYDDGTTTTISFIRPRVSDHFQDIGLDQCVFVIWAFGGFVLNHATPASFSRHTDRGVFGTQLCLQECAPPPPACTGTMTVGSYMVEWKTDEDSDYVKFKYSADTTNWVGLGFSLTANMPNSDVVVGAVEGDAYFVEDRYVGDVRTAPTFDTTQDIKNVSAYDDGTTTTISFIRPRVSSDDAEDIDLDQCVFMIWAFGGPVTRHESPAVFGFHTSQGVFATQLCLQKCAPPAPPAPGCTGTMTVGSYMVEWKTEEDNDYVKFTYSAETTEWVGIGFSLSDNMLNSHVVVGAIEGDAYFVEDRYVGDVRIPVFDTTQDIKNVSAYDDGRTTTISFIRPRSSDDSEDIDLDQCVFMIWAFGGFVLNHATPASFSQHTERGVFATQLCLQECGDRGGDDGGASGLVVSMASLLLAVILSVYTNMF